MNAPDTPRSGWGATLERLAAMPAFLEAALHEAGEENLRMRPSAEEFSLVEQACHLRDLEREGYLLRVRRILSESSPRLDDFDGQAVAAARDYPRQDAHAAAQDFAAARRELIAVLAALSAQDLAREALFDGRRVSLADLIVLIDAHDTGHREEIERILDDIED
jgi:hypothetical protein